MMSVINDAFDSLKTVGCVSSQREFSTEWLGKRSSYFSSMVARRAARRPSTDALLTLYSRLRQHVEDSGFQRAKLERLAEQVWIEIMDRVPRAPEHPEHHSFLSSACWVGIPGG
ncbi:DUF6626 family protein [Azospirillum argentinense]|uniref:DUF6626 family protein n=1 Tax=Azospirillum argentinense TaxID=2970906 RepID=UPI0011856808|nr:DUF6626 family protein [Azospirillum argentinense]